MAEMSPNPQYLLQASEKTKEPQQLLDRIEKYKPQLGLLAYHPNAPFRHFEKILRVLIEDLSALAAEPLPEDPAEAEAIRRSFSLEWQLCSMSFERAPFEIETHARDTKEHLSKLKGRGYDVDKMCLAHRADPVGAPEWRTALKKWDNWYEAFHNFTISTLPKLGKAGSGQQATSGVGEDKSEDKGKVDEKSDVLQAA